MLPKLTISSNNQSHHAKMKKLLLVLTALLFSFYAFSDGGDTIRVMQYNLLYYDMNTGFCNSSNNNVDLKDQYLQTILGHYKPDIFTVNEMGGSLQSVDRLMNNALNVNGINYYKRANYTGSYIVNMLYYNSNLLQYHSQSFILTTIGGNNIRITDVYKLYYKSSTLEKGDTTFLTCMVGHLKAGNGTEEVAIRQEAAQQIMAFIKNRNIQGNILLMGDFNLYRASEPAFQTFMTPTTTGVRFYDPVNALGDWQDNPFFAQYHTQSTHTESNCYSGGGMDDRFDFILATQQILQGTEGIKYVPNSYWAFGQDGNRLNSSLINPVNNSLPANVIDALYYNSDHLPVVLKLFFEDNNPGSSLLNTQNKKWLRFSNTGGGELQYWSNSSSDEVFNLTIHNLIGSKVYEKNVTILPGEKQKIDISSLSTGIYLVRAYKEGSAPIVTRIAKQ